MKTYGVNTTLPKHNLPIAISDYLEADLVVFLDEDKQKDALEILVTLLDKKGKLTDKEGFTRAIFEREKIVSTGIGIGVAIPHAKLAGYKDFFLAIGIQKGKGIPWGSLDGLPVQLIFLIGGPEDKQKEYLTILSMITTAIKDEDRRAKLLKAKSGEEVASLFENL